MFTTGNSYRFKPGQSGNPSGINHTTSLLAALNKEVQKIRKGKRKTNAQLIAEAVVTKAVDGDLAAASLVFDRIYGKARQAVDVEMNPSDWREVASQLGLTETDVAGYAQQLVESVHAGGDSGGSDQGEP